MTIAPRDEAGHDAWLREALRHAPDAEVAPPPRLRAQILQAADRAAQPRAAWLSPGRWFAQPAWAGGLASLFVATVVVVLWSPWSGAPDATVAQAPAAADDAMRSAQVAAPPAAPPAAVPTAPPEARTDTRVAETRREQRAERAKAKTEAAAVSPPAPAPAAGPAATMDAPAPARRAAETASAEVARDDRAADTVARRTALAGAVATAAPAAAPPARAEDASPLAAPRRGLRTEPDAWSWRRGGGDPVEASDALRDWLDRLDAATAGRWQVIEADPPGSRVLGTLTLLREGRVHTIVRLESDGVSRRGSVRVRAPLEAATAADLAEALRQLAP